MSGSFVLDTNIVLHLIRGQALGKKIDQAFGLSSSLHRQVVSIVTQAELWVIADRKGWGTAKRSSLEDALDHLVVIPIDGSGLVEAYVRIAHADFEAGGGARNMGKNDIWIAGTAFYTQLPLLTTDKDLRFLHADVLQVMWIDSLGV